MKTKDIIRIDTIEEYTEWIGGTASKHPLFSIVRMSELKKYISADKPIQLNLYAITIKDGINCNATYGWRNYDFKKGLINFYAPGQIHTWGDSPENPSGWGWLLAFHPDFIRKYPLSTKIDRLKFFSYDIFEALHMSDSERDMIVTILENIEQEYRHSIDSHSQDIIVSQLETLLSYSERFYTRQFQTRNSVESDVVTRFQTILKSHIERGREGLITAGEIASELTMSPHYLSDLLRNLTGQNTQQHIHEALISKAKGLLLTTKLSVNEIAYSLGFEYPQYFSRLFKNKTGYTPIEFRNNN
ncbi:MAG: helix-turn-helix domain-containing protein [Marinifilaceae bacterium]